MTIDTNTQPTEDGGEPLPRRLYLHETGWRVGMKTGSTREFCYKMAPGQDYYHRLQDTEVYVQRGDEKLCIACAERVGVISFEPRILRNPEAVPVLGLEGSDTEIQLAADDEDE
jgi:hypothetical protein